MNKVDYLVFLAGVRRGGQHAASGWLLMQLPCNVIHNVNDIKDLSQIKKIHGKNNLVIFKKTKEGIKKSTTRDVRDFWNQSIQCLIVGIEDIEVDKFPVRSIDDLQNNIHHKHLMKILVIRDPFNTMASLKKVGRGTKRDLQRWKKLAREALGQTSYINFDHIFLYNRWFLDHRYKKEIASKMGLEYVGENNCVYDFGGGSSYDKLKYNGCPSQMKVLDRWKTFKNNRAFTNLFDAETIKLSNKLFGPLPDVERFFNNA